MKNKRYFIILIIILTILYFWANGLGSEPHPNEPIAQVNDYLVTVADFHDYYARVGHYRTDKGKIREEMIEKHLLVEEAQRLGIDREESFRKTIERYWKQTLIKELYERITKTIPENLSNEQQQAQIVRWQQQNREKADIIYYNDTLEKIKLEPTSENEGA